MPGVHTLVTFHLCTRMFLGDCLSVLECLIAQCSSVHEDKGCHRLYNDDSSLMPCKCSAEIAINH